MGTLVFLQASYSIETHVALFTMERFLSAVDALVTPQGTSCTETLLTLLTGVRFFSRVGTLVCLKAL